VDLWFYLRLIQEWPKGQGHMNVEPKLNRESPARWVGAVTLMPEEAEQVVQLLPSGPLRGALRQTLDAARARATTLNEVDANGVLAPLLEAP